MGIVDELWTYGNRCGSDRALSGGIFKNFKVARQKFFFAACGGDLIDFLP